MKALHLITMAAALVLVAAGCASSAQTVSSATASAGAAKADSAATADSTAKKNKITEAVKASRKYDGLFTVYQDTTNGSLQMVVNKDQLDKEYIYFTFTADGPVAAGHFRGLFRDNRIFSIRKHFNKIELVAENTSFHFDSTNALSRAAAANISPAILASVEIAATDSAAGDYLVKADELFLTEAFSQVKPPPNPNARPGTTFTLGQLSRAKTKYAGLKNYPENLDILVEYVYENPSPTVGGDPGVTDPRNVSIRIQHSFIEVPQNDYRPRFDDARIGYFTQEVNDMTSASAAPYRDLINRWHLVKKEPGAALSEPVEPIVFWIENTTPVEIRGTIAGAVLAWNKAFEAAGFRNAVQVQVQPDDADWEAGDIRYNVLRWTSSPLPPFGGYGPSFVNPRTGQILGADIMLEYVFLTNRLRQERAFDTAALGLEDAATHPEGNFCSLGFHLQTQVQFGLQALKAFGAPEMEVTDYINESLHFLILHEVGHTLGLNHNMKASQLHAPERINDRRLTREMGLMGSVMDYPAVNLAPPGQEQGQYMITGPGPYDLWAIDFGYSEALSDLQAEQARLERILARSTEPELAFGNDADDMRSPGKAIDPRVMIDDMSSDAIGYSVGRMELVNGVMARVRDRYRTEGETYHELRNAYLVLTGTYHTAAVAISRYIGGVYVDRAVVGQPGATQPFTPVSRADQERAMAALRTHVFSPEAYQIDSDLYNYLQMQRRGFGFFSTSEDPKIHARVLSMQENILAHLLHPAVLTRITDTRLYGNEYPLAEMVQDLTAAVFADDAQGDANTFRQNLQVAYVNRLANVISDAGRQQYDNVAQSAAVYNLQQIRTLLGRKRGTNPETAAHTAHMLLLIDRALAVD